MVTPKFDSGIVLAFTYVAIKPRKVRRCTPSSVIYLQPSIGGGRGRGTDGGTREAEGNGGLEGN